MTERLFLIVFPIFSIALAGFIYARLKPTDMRAANRMNMDVFVPALIFHVLANKSPKLADYAGLALGGLMLVFAAGALGWLLARLLGYPVKVFVPPVMFKNTGNIGLPLAVFAFGEQALPGAVILFVLSSFVHFTFGNYWLGHRVGWAEILRVPMIHAAALGLLFGLMHWSVPAFLAVPLEMVARISVPLMIFALGVRMIDIDFGDWRIGLIGAAGTPAIGVLSAWLITRVLDLPGDQAALLIAFGALPPAVINFIFAETYGLAPQRVAAMVMLGNAGAVISLPLVLAWVI